MVRRIGQRARWQGAKERKARRYEAVTRRAAFSAAAALFLGITLILGACAGTEQKGAQPAAKESQAEQAGNADASSSGLAEPALDRKIIQNASLELQVEDVTQAYQATIRIATTAGGFVLDSSSTSSDDQPEANLTIRVPASQYEDVLGQLRGLAIKVEKEGSEAQDVTEEYTDVQARLRSYEALETTYMGFLDRAQNIDEVLKVQDRLTQVRLEIEKLQGRANAIDTLSDLVTITVHLQTEPAAEAGVDLDPLGAAGKAWEASLTTLRALATGILVFVVYLWWLLPVLAVGGLGYLLIRRGRAKPPGTTP